MPDQDPRAEIAQELSAEIPEGKEAISLEYLSSSEENLPGEKRIRTHYPSVRDALIDCGYRYRRNDWETEFSLTEEDYPEDIQTELQRDIYAFYLEEDAELTDIVDTFGTRPSTAAETIGKIRDPGPAAHLD